MERSRGRPARALVEREHSQLDSVQEVTVAHEKIEVEKLGEDEFEVRITDAGAERPGSRHRVTATAGHLEAYGPDAEPEQLVEESFRFLLEREPKEAILSRFELPTIERYFPEYREEIRRRLGGGLT